MEAGGVEPSVIPAKSSGYIIGGKEMAKGVSIALPVFPLILPRPEPSTLSELILSDKTRVLELNRSPDA